MRNTSQVLQQNQVPANGCAPKRITQFDEQLADFSNQLDRMDKLLCAHSEKLRPISRETDLSNGAQAQPEPVLVPLAAEIRARVCRLDQLIRGLESIHERIEC